MASAKRPSGSSAAAPAAAGERRNRPTENAPGHRWPEAFYFTEDCQTVRMRQVRRSECPDASRGAMISRLCGGVLDHPHRLAMVIWDRLRRTETHILDYLTGKEMGAVCRVAFAACNRWGLAIELLIEALTICQLAGEKVSTVEHFSQAFSKIYSTPPGYTPFDLSDYQDGFDHEKLLAVLDNSDD